MKTVINAAAHIREDDLQLPQELVKDLRRADSFIIMAVAVCHLLMQENHLEPVAPEETGLIITTVFGPMQTNFDVLASILDDGQASPTLFSHSVYNGAAGYLSRILDIRGPSQTITDFANPFFHGLQYACGTLAAGRIKRCLVVQVETYSKLLHDFRKRSLVAARQWTGAACVWLVENKAANNRAYTLNKLIIDTRQSAPVDAVDRKETLTINLIQKKMREPIAAAAVLTEQLTAGRQQVLACYLDGPFGTTELLLQKHDEHP